MNKATLISIRPEHLVNILNGKKTLELRKTVPKNYAGWVYIYCTKAGNNLIHYDKKYYIEQGKRLEYDLNGKVVARFWFDYYDNLEFNDFTGKEKYEVCPMDQRGFCWLAEEEKYMRDLCLDIDEIEKYGKGKDLYAWHIKKLEIFDEPMELGVFKVYDNTYDNVGAFGWMFDEDEKYYSIKKPPQSWQYVYVKGVKE